MANIFYALSMIALLVAIVVGWVINFVAVIKMAVAGSALTTLFILKAVGIVVAPLGVVLGLFV